MLKNIFWYLVRIYENIFIFSRLGRLDRLVTLAWLGGSAQFELAVQNDQFDATRSIYLLGLIIFTRLAQSSQLPVHLKQFDRLNRPNCVDVVIVLTDLLNMSDLIGLIVPTRPPIMRNPSSPIGLIALIGPLDPPDLLEWPANQSTILAHPSDPQVHLGRLAWPDRSA